MAATSRFQALRILWLPVKHLAYWAPVWIPLGLLAQIALLGLRPARAEGERLEREAAGVLARHERTEAEWERMRAEREAWDDEVWRERMRRARIDMEESSTPGSREER